MKKRGLILASIFSSSLLADFPTTEAPQSIPACQDTIKTDPAETKEIPSDVDIFDDPAAVEDMLKVLDDFEQVQEKPTLLSKIKLALSFIQFQLSNATQSLKDFVASLFKKQPKDQKQ